MQSKYRLKSRRSFTFVYKRGKGFRRGHLTLITAPTKYGMRFGFVCGKKIGKAVVRNKVKRRLKEIIRNQLPNLTPKLNYVFVAQEGIAELTFAKLQENVAQVLQKFNVSHETSSNGEK